jgi:cytidylate kinase
MATIIAICGKICSGKTTLAKAVSYGLNVDVNQQKLRQSKNQLDCVVIEVSDIVRKISKATDRKQLQDTASLDMEIYNAIVVQIEMNPNATDIVINGLRQLSIYKALQVWYEITGIWIEVSDKVRKQRYEGRVDVKDNQSFEQSDLRDVALGINELKNHILK